MSCSLTGEYSKVLRGRGGTKTMWNAPGHETGGLASFSFLFSKEGFTSPKPLRLQAHPSGKKKKNEIK